MVTRVGARRVQAKKRGGRRFAFLRALLVAVLCVAFVAAGFVGYYYRSYSEKIDDWLSGKHIQGESLLFTRPKRVSVGQEVDPDWLATHLKNSGYSATGGDGTGRVTRTGSTFQIQPGVKSYFGGKNGVRIEFAGGVIRQLTALDSGERLLSAEIEPELITNLFGRDREKRRPLRYAEFPETFVNAILSAEDKRFFDHPGLDPVRALGAAWHDVQKGAKAQGASTITMQVARSFFFDTRREWRRKVKETFMALLLEHRFSKEEIFELYANEVYLGNRGTFAIHGFGEAAQAYFGKDLSELSLGQVAFLGGIIRAPNRYSSAERHPERAAEARDRVLGQMRENGAITDREYRRAKGAPIELVRGNQGSNPSGHFVDMVRDALSEKFSEADLVERNYRIYTSLDTDLQRVAIEAAEWGMGEVDKKLEKTYERWRREGGAVPTPQVALVALDPHTGEVKALVGGRDYAQSQLNHALANRQPGSVFKPFVYAAALETALTPDANTQVYTPVTTLVDEPTTFYFGGRPYTPNNYGQDFYGTVTLREALKRSLNIATVKLAENVGYKRIADFCKRLGIKSDIQPTPAMALGSYEMTPLEVAKGYTAFANYGVLCEPELFERVVTRDGRLVDGGKAGRRRPVVLDQRIAYLVTNLMEEVLNRGTGAGVRSRGFRAPAAGKTGSSRDGWFAGFTSNLLCVVWVGFDDNRDLHLTGGASAGLIWGEFMKRAAQLPAFSDMQPFSVPEGIVTVSIDTDTLLLAREECPSVREEVFVAGTEPVDYCNAHRLDPMDFSGIRLEID
ncbi:MAG: PBP1A family penicillin-binding protein [Acidobacteriota bacterium]|jgi:penicillin-binding protein 1B|nr:PBP1A family penicillin-binding protein [Acidobacteriota bacterium]